MAEEPDETGTETGAAIEVSFPIERAVRLVKEIELIPRFMLHEGKKQIRDLFGLRDTLAEQLVKIAAEKGITT
jgi:hypothetical protein